MSEKFIVAIDGPSSSGKGTIAKKIAESLGFIYLDTGAMYRALTYYCLQNNVDITSEAAVYAALNEVSIDFSQDGKTFVNMEDVSEAIRSNEVSRYVSENVSTYASIRAKMVELQRAYANDNQIVIDGRDIGTVVFPDADVKLFITASLPVRAKRRYDQNVANGITTGLAETEAMLAYRDRTDIGRENSPLVLAKDSIVIDSSHLGVEETLAKSLAYINMKN